MSRPYTPYVPYEEAPLSPRRKQASRRNEQGSYSRQYNRGIGDQPRRGSGGRYSPQFREFLNQHRAERSAQAVEEEFIPGTGMLSQQGHNLSSMNRFY